MDSGLITALTGLLLAIGGGVGFLIRRADKNREAREAMLIKNLEEQLKKSQLNERRLERINRMLRADATAWREQLIRNDIEPEPIHWTPAPEEDE